MTHERDQATADFVQKEIDRFLDLWKHADSRVSATFTLVIAFFGAAASVVGIYVGSSGADALLASAWASGLVGVVLFILSVRMIGTEVTKTEYLTAVNMLRWFASEGMTGLSAIMFVTPLKPPTVADSKDEGLSAWFETQLSLRLPLMFRILLHVAIGSAFGLLAGAVIWARDSSSSTLGGIHVIALGVGLVVAFVVGIGHREVLNSYQQRRIAYARDRYLSWIDETHSDRHTGA